MSTADDDFIRLAFIEKKRMTTISSLERPNKQYRQLAPAHDPGGEHFYPFTVLVQSKFEADQLCPLLVGCSVNPTPFDGSRIPGARGPFEPFGSRL